MIDKCADGCGRDVVHMGFCRRHYQARWRLGYFRDKGLNTPLTQRLQENIEYDTNGGCWLWTGNVMRTSGYGTIKIRQKRILAHRAAWMTWRGTIPPGKGYHGTCVCHRCDVRVCINPDHLFLGSNQDNIDDKMAKGRGGTSKLTLDQVLTIRARLKIGEKPPVIAREYGVARVTIERIRDGSRWQRALSFDVEATSPLRC